MKTEQAGAVIEKISVVMIAAVFFILLWIHMDVNLHHYNVKMDADIASDTLLAPALYENGYVTPSTWCGSAEVCIISAPNIASVLYPFLGRNMNLSMGVACNILTVLFFGFMFACLRQMKFSWRGIFLSSVLIFSLSDVNSDNQSVLFLWAAYYASHFVTLFIITIFYNTCLKKKKVPIIIWLSGIALATVNSLQGMHAALFCYLPLLIVEMVRWMVYFIRNRGILKELSILLWLSVLSLISVFGSSVFGSFTSNVSRNIRHSFEKFLDSVLPGMGGVINTGLLPIVVIALVLSAALGYILFLGKLLGMGKKGEASPEAEQNWPLLSPVVSLIVCMLAMTFTTFEVAPRYFITELLIVGFGVMLLTDEVPLWPRLVVMLAVMVTGISASKYYYEALIKNDNVEQMAENKVVEWMQDNGYEYGYATFDFANTITVVSNNSVKVRPVTNMRDLVGLKWLSDSRWYPPVKDANTATCYITTEYSKDNFRKWMRDNNVLEKSVNTVDRYTIYVLDHDYTTWEE